MQGYDIAMLVVMGFAIMRGYSKGLAWQISSIVSIVASYIVAYRFKNTLAPHLDIADPWRGVIAMMILFVGTSLVIWFVFQNIRGAIEKAKLKDFDHQLGAIFGGVKGAAWCTAITIVALSFLQSSLSQQIVNSRSGGYIARILANSKQIIPREIQQIVQPYIQRAEDQLGERNESATATSNDWLPTDQWSQQQTINQTPPQTYQQQPSFPPANTDDAWFRDSQTRPDPLSEFSNNGQ